jgi:hypothetical protein
VFILGFFRLQHYCCKFGGESTHIQQTYSLCQCHKRSPSPNSDYYGAFTYIYQANYNHIKSKKNTHRNEKLTKTLKICHLSQKYIFQNFNSQLYARHALSKKGAAHKGESPISDDSGFDFNNSI